MYFRSKKEGVLFDLDSGYPSDQTIRFSKNSDIKRNPSNGTINGVGNKTMVNRATSSPSSKTLPEGYLKFHMP